MPTSPLGTHSPHHSDEHRETALDEDGDGESAIAIAQKVSALSMTSIA